MKDKDKESGKGIHQPPSGWAWQSQTIWDWQARLKKNAVKKVAINITR